MTALRERRRRSTWLALAVTVLALAGAGALTWIGVDTLADSTAGNEVGVEDSIVAARRLPFTPTALLGTLDDAGRLTSVTVLALQPDAVGGSMVSLAASAVAGADGVSLGQRLEDDGAEAFRLDVESLTGLSFDIAELVDEARFVALMGAVDEISVSLPDVVIDASTNTEWPAGDQELELTESAALVTAVNPSIPDWTMEPARRSVWQGIAEAVGDGTGANEPVSTDADPVVPGSVDGFVERLFSAPVGYRALAFTVPGADDGDGSDVGDDAPPADTVVHDRADVLMVMSSIAPARIGAPLDAPTFRVESAFEPDDLPGFNNADVTKVAIDRLLFVQVNIVSVADRVEGGVPGITRLLVTDSSMLDAVEARYPDIFGELDVQIATSEQRIDGVDIIVTLGRSFVDQLPSDLSEADPVTAGTVADE